MREDVGNFLFRKAPSKGDPSVPESFLDGSPMRKGFSRRKQVFTKVFRWQLQDGSTRKPASVEVVGSFTRWQKVPLSRNGEPDVWQVMLHEIPNNRTHRYMILIDGQPVYDKFNDGLAIPQGPDEKKYQIMTDKGPRVFMLFAQTK